MKKTRHTEEKIIETIKQLEAGRSAKDVTRELGVSDQTLYNWKAKYGGMEVSDAKKLRALEDENRRLTLHTVHPQRSGIKNAVLLQRARADATMCSASWTLCDDAEDSVDELTLTDRIALSDPTDLPFSDCMHRLVTFDRVTCAVRRAKSEARRNPLLDETVVLLDNVV